MIAFFTSVCVRTCARRRMRRSRPSPHVIETSHPHILRQARVLPGCLEPFATPAPLGKHMRPTLVCRRSPASCFLGQRDGQPVVSSGAPLLTLLVHGCLSSLTTAARMQLQQQPPSFTWREHGRPAHQLVVGRVVHHVQHARLARDRLRAAPPVSASTASSARCLGAGLRWLGPAAEVAEQQLDTAARHDLSTGPGKLSSGARASEPHEKLPESRRSARNL